MMQETKPNAQPQARPIAVSSFRAPMVWESLESTTPRISTTSVAHMLYVLRRKKLNILF